MTPQQIRFLIGLSRAADSFDGMGDLAEFFPEVDWAAELTALEAEERVAWEKRMAERGPRQNDMTAAVLDSIFKEVFAEHLSEKLSRPNPLMDLLKK